MTQNRVERSFYANGQLRWEGSFKDGKLHGKNRHWHKNGQLSEETSYEDGLENGIGGRWASDGRILGEYRLDHGTGTAKSWYENGQLKNESSIVQGKLCGRFRSWYEDGEVVSTDYYIMGKKVSKKRYIEACKSDPRLPQYEDEASVPAKPEIAAIQQKSDEPISESKRLQHEEFINKFLRQPNRAEARRWLAGDQTRSIGEMTWEESRELIEEGYKAGAIKILAVEIEGKTTDCLIVGLSTNEEERNCVFEWNNKRAQSAGFDADIDWGQKELFVFFD